MDFNIFEELGKEWAVIGQAPPLFFFGVGLLGAGIWLLLHFIHRERFNAKAEQLIAKDERIGALHIQMEALRAQQANAAAQIAQWDPNLHSLAFGMMWVDKKTPCCVVCRLPLHQTIEDYSIFQCPQCKTDYPLTRGTKKYSLDKALEAIQKGEV